MQIHIIKDGQQHGPYPGAEVVGYLQTGQFSATDLAWREGLPEWVPLSQLVSIPSPTTSSTGSERLDYDGVILITGYSPNIGVCRGMLITDTEVLYLDGPVPPTTQMEFWVTTVGLILIFWPALPFVIWWYFRRRHNPLLREAWAMLNAGDFEGLQSTGVCRAFDINTVRRTSPWVRVCNPKASRFFFRASGRDGGARVLIRRPQQEMDLIRKAAERLGDPI